MPTPAFEDFIAWLDQELDRLSWSDYQLSRRAGISHSAISRARHGTLPGWSVCEAIARALNVPAELVFRKANLLPELPEGDLSFEQWQHVLAQLSDEDRQELLQIAHIKLSAQKKRAQQEHTQLSRRASLGDMVSN